MVFWSEPLYPMLSAPGVVTVKRRSSIMVGIDRSLSALGWYVEVYHELFVDSGVSCDGTFSGGDSFEG